MRQVLPVVGAAIGAYFGGAQGAQWGWAIGSVIGNAVDPVVIKGPSIGDLTQQTSQEGVPRPIFFGLSQPVAGNIVACSQPKIVTHRKRQGKGGPVTETQSVYRTFAIAVGEGPITSFVRVWSNGKLVYDARPQGDASNNSKFLENAVFHLGGFNQNPDSYLSAVFGASNTPAMRGTAYVAWHDVDLTSQGGAVPQCVFQVLRCEGMMLTSRPYAVEETDAVTGSVSMRRVHFQPQPTISGDALSGVVSVMAINRYGGQVTYTAPNEDAVTGSVAPISIDRYGGQVIYSAPPEDAVTGSVAPISIDRYGGQVIYPVPPGDAISGTVAVVSITRSTD